ncbi:MAG TPA: hypothetical protein VLZ54_00765, partial [Arenibacter sp.]|nr:hypothetical protein [Arenibacter sp.]
MLESKRTSEIYYKSILKALPDTIFICDVKGVLLDIIEAKKSQISFPKKDTIGENIWNMVLDKSECDKILRTLAKVARTKEIEIAETRISVVGRIMDFEVRVVPFEKE